MSTNFQLERLKINLDIVEKPENRVHKLTDSNVSHCRQPIPIYHGPCYVMSCGRAILIAERSLDTVVRAVSASVLPVWVDFTSLKVLPCAPGPATTRRGMLVTNG